MTTSDGRPDSLPVSRFQGETALRECLAPDLDRDVAGWTRNVLLWWRHPLGDWCDRSSWRCVDILEAPFDPASPYPAGSIIAFHDGTAWRLSRNGDVHLGPDGWTDSDPARSDYWRDFQERTGLASMSAEEMRAAMIRDVLAQAASMTMSGRRIDVSQLATDRFPTQAELRAASWSEPGDEKH